MFERFTTEARQIVADSRRQAVALGHQFIGCEHLLLAIAGIDDPTGALFRDAGITPDRVRAELLHMIGPGRRAELSVFDTLDREALAAIGIDLDVVRAKVEELFGPIMVPPPRLSRRRRWWRRPRAGRRPGQRPNGHVPFTHRAKKTLELSLRNAARLHSGHIGVEHLALGLLEVQSSAAVHILSVLGVVPADLRVRILDRHRKAS